MGLESMGDKKVPVTLRNWSAIKLALWRSKVSWDIATRAAQEIIAGCRHAEGCPGAVFEHEPCFAACPDRETRMSACVILNAGRVFGPVNVPRPDAGPYFAPSREYFSEVLADLLATQEERDALRTLNVTGVDPPKNEEPEGVAPALPVRKLAALPAPAQLATVPRPGPWQRFWNWIREKIK